MPYFELEEGGEITWSDRAGPGLRVYQLIWTQNQRRELYYCTAVRANGAFSEYLIADAELQVVPIPVGWSFEEAAQLGVAPLTTLHSDDGLFQKN